MIINLGAFSPSAHQAPKLKLQHILETIENKNAGIFFLVPNPAVPGWRVGPVPNKKKSTLSLSLFPI